MNETLLSQFARTKDEAAFEKLVEKHAGLVYGTALRRTRDPEAARDITQNVFVILARKAQSLVRSSDTPGLGPWLHRTTVFESANHIRKEATRQRTMREFTVQNGLESEGSALWEKAASILDAAIDKLPAADRQIIWLRFYEDKSFRDIGRVLGKSEDAAQKRASRALEKLSRLLRRKGVAVPAVMLASGLGSQLCHAAPAGLAASVCSAAVAAALQVPGGTVVSQILVTAMNAKFQTAAVVTLAALAIPAVMQQRTIASLDRKVAVLETEKKTWELDPAIRGSSSLPQKTASSGNSAPSAASRSAASPSEPVLDLDALLDDIIAGVSNVDLTRMAGAMAKVAQLDSDQLAEILAMLEEKRVTPRDADQVVNMLFDGASDENYAFILGYAIEKRDHFSSAADALRVWAEQDFEAASAWFDEQRQQGALESKSLNEDAEDILAGGLIAGAAKDTLDLAVEMLNESGEKAGEFAIAKIVQRFLIENAGDHRRILDLANRLETGAHRAYALKRYAITLGGFTDFETAAAFAEGLELPPDQRNEIFTNLASLQGTRNAQERLDWLVSRSPPEFVDENVNDFVFQWAITDAARAAAWTESQAGTSYRDAAVEALAIGHLARQKHSLAGEWAARIDDEDRRKRVARRIHETWARTDPEAAQRFLEQAGAAQRDNP